MTLKGWVEEEGTDHRPVPKTTAKVGVVLGPGANLGATVEPRAKIVPKAAHMECMSHVP